jgi:hypothetical protein
MNLVFFVLSHKHLLITGGGSCSAGCAGEFYRAVEQAGAQGGAPACCRRQVVNIQLNAHPVPRIWSRISLV